MLKLLQSPTWTSTDGATPHAVPATLPGALLLHLAALGDGRGAWVERERVIALFWPDLPTAEGQHNLRVNLHRLRRLLQSWERGEDLDAERTRLRLRLPTDLASLPVALCAPDAGALLQVQPAGWLQGFRLPGFEGFREWADAEGRRWRDAWAAAVERQILRGLVGNEEVPISDLFEAWRAAGGERLPAVEMLDPAAVSAGARLAWGQLRVRLRHLQDDDPTVQVAPAQVESRPQLLAGRRSEQQALLAVETPAAVVLGEPGIGKTTLLSACWPQAPLLQGREGLTAAPYAPLLDWLRRHPARWRARLAAQSSPLAAYRLDLARLIPELAPDEPLPPLDAYTAKARLLEALCRVFEAEGPVLRVEDLQWCDSATIEWLVFVAHRGQQRWRATARRHELPGPYHSTLESLRAAGRLAELSLEPLDRRALGDACRSRWPTRFEWGVRSELVLDGLHARSAGNPFVLVELLQIEADRRFAEGERVELPSRVLDLVARRLATLPPPSRSLVEACAVMGQPVAPPLLQKLCDHAEEAFWCSCRAALDAGLLVDEGAGLQCRHDLIRTAALTGLGVAHRQWLHRGAALMLGAQHDADPLVVAAHWQAANEPQTALSWLHRAAALHKDRGRFDEARVLWRRVANESEDRTLSLQAQLALAECELFDNLVAGRAALESLLPQIDAVPDLAARDCIEGLTLSGLVDNAVFSGDLARAASHAVRLRELLPRLPAEGRVHACEVLIELAMREPDFDGARALLRQIELLAPRRPGIMSFRAQIHWFSGDVRAAREELESLLAAHPAYCSGLTIENDLAVMLHALGDLGRAEAMARRSLESWRGVAHTETLSLLVMGSIFTSAGRHGEALCALDQAVHLGRAQGSALFEAEACVRRARLRMQCGQPEAAREDLDLAVPLLRESRDPLRVSGYVATRAACAAALAQPQDPAWLERLRAISVRSAHPLLHVRLARTEVLSAWAAGDPARAADAATRMQEFARAAGLLESLSDALIVQADVAVRRGRASEVSPWLHEAAALADAQGFIDLSWRAHRALAQVTRSPVHHAASLQALARLAASGHPHDARRAAQDWTRPGNVPAM